MNEIEPLADAIIDIMLPGNYGGDALAALIAGEENFSGRLPFTYPKYTNKLAVYDYKPCENQETMSGAYNYNAVMDVQWPFGYGLSYTDFVYSNMKVDKCEFSADDTLNISIDVTNVGEVHGKKSVLLFSSDMYASSIPDIRRLRDFAKVDLCQGKKETITFKLPAKDLAFVNYHGKWTLEEGVFVLSIGDESVTVNCTETVVWDNPNI